MTGTEWRVQKQTEARIRVQWMTQESLQISGEGWSGVGTIGFPYENKNKLHFYLL